VDPENHASLQDVLLMNVSLSDYKGDTRVPTENLPIVKIVEVVVVVVVEVEVGNVLRNDR
jgi:hypothetical protein